MLAILGMAVVFNSLVLLLNAIMQAHGDVTTPVINMLIGGIVKIIVNYILVAQHHRRADRNARLLHRDYRARSCFDAPPHFRAPDNLQKRRPATDRLGAHGRSNVPRVPGALFPAWLMEAFLPCEPCVRGGFVRGSGRCAAVRDV